MELTKLGQQMLEGELGEATRQSMEILVALGKIYGAKGMVPVASSQIAGVSYKTIGQAGLEYLQDLVKGGARVRIPSFLNPAGMDRAQWKEMGIPPEFAAKQSEVLDAYLAMGIGAACTCTPYLVGIRPKAGEHLAWSESSAVVFANSVLGARTNREGGPSALAAAICGATPDYGYHSEANRVCSMLISVETGVQTASDFGALGAFAGEASKGANVAFSGVRKSNATEDRLKGMGAAMAAWGSNALFNIEGITPEWRLADGAERVSFGRSELSAMKEKMGTGEKPQLVAIGCPHASLAEIREAASFVQGRELACQLWVCTARQTKELADSAGYTATIEAAGGRVVADTCMVVCPIQEMGFSFTSTNSGKAAKYLVGMCRQKVSFGDLQEIISFK